MTSTTPLSGRERRSAKRAGEGLGEGTAPPPGRLHGKPLLTDDT